MHRDAMASTTRPARARPRDDRPDRLRPTSSPTSWRFPSTCATRCGRSSRPTWSRGTAPGGLVVAGHGRLGDRRRAGARDRSATTPRGRSCRRARLRPAAVDDARHHRPVRVATRATPRRRSPATRRPACSARARVVVTTGGKLAELARADDVPVIPVAGGLQPRAAVAYMTVAALEVAALLRRRAADELRASTSPPTTSRSSSSSGAPTAAEDSEAKALARALHGTVPVIAGAGLDGADRLPLEDADQRERQDPGVRARAARDRPQRDRRLGRRGRARALQRGLPRRLRHAPARSRERIELTERLIARRRGRRRTACRSRGQTTVERVFSLVLLGDLVSVYLAVLRGVDPEPVDADRAAEGRAGRALAPGKPRMAARTAGHREGHAALPPAVPAARAAVASPLRARGAAALRAHARAGTLGGSGACSLLAHAPPHR